MKDFDGAASDVKIEWFKDGTQVPRFGSTMTIERTYSSQLMINRPKISDGGKYTCKTEINGERQEVSAEISFVDPPKFLNIKEEQHPEEGTRAEIVCEVEGTDQLEVFWQFNGVTLDETSQRGYEFSENNQILYIPHFTAKIDDGIYNCNAAQYSSFETLSLNVTGYARPMITVFDVPNGNRGIEGHTIELKCGAVGKPIPSYKWFFEDDEIPITRSDKHNVDEGLLIIESLNSEDAGKYKCVANNTVGSNEKTFDLTVFLKPKVELKHEHVVKEGDDVELICGYHGEGQVTAKFTSGNSEFSVKRAQSHEKTAEGISAQVDEETDGDSEQNSEETTTTSSQEGSQENRASDEVELKSAEADVSEESETEKPSSQENDEENDKETEEEDKRKKRSTLEQNSDRFSVRNEDTKIILTIKSVTLEDAAEYSCQVTNDAGTTKKVTNLGIIHPPTLRHYTGPRVRSFNGNTVSIYCDVSAVPSPTWNWFKNGKPVEANGASIQIDTQQSSTKLTLENFEGSDNFGVYSCQAENSVGKLEKQIEVIRVVKPATPSGMDCKKIIYPNYGKCSFESDIYEKEESKPTTMDFLIAKFEEMESYYNWSDAHLVTVPFEEDITIPELSPNTQYVVKARANNEAGSSEYSEEISFETTDPWAPQSPSSVQMKCSEYCTLSWDTPNTHGSPITKFKISIQEMKMKSEETATSTETSAETSAENTENNEKSAEKEEDETEKSSEKEQEEKDENNSAEQDHSQPQEEQDRHQSHEQEQEQDDVTLEDDSAEILPTDPTTSSENHRNLVPHGSLTILEVDANENSLQLTSIKPHSYYKISVAAENAIGQGEPAAIDYQTDATPTKYDEGLDSTLLVIAICAAVAICLLLIDLGCYITNRCGLISCICLNLCGRNSGAKQRDLESGRGGPESNRLLDSSGAR